MKVILHNSQWSLLLYAFPNPYPPPQLYYRLTEPTTKAELYNVLAQLSVLHTNDTGTSKQVAQREDNNIHSF
jgi:hypothetical protein